MKTGEWISFKQILQLQRQQIDRNQAEFANQPSGGQGSPGRETIELILDESGSYHMKDTNSTLKINLSQLNYRITVPLQSLWQNHPL